MLNVILKGHDFKYEVAELIKLFTTQFKFVDNKDVGMTLENSVVYYNDKVFSKTVYLENYQAIYDSLDHRSIAGLSEQEIKKVTKETIKRSMYNVLMKKFNSYVPWGILTGIRPVKIVHTLLDKNLSDEDIRENLKTNYLISDEKIDLALNIAKRERKFIYPIDKNKISLYVSIPFCPTRCYYCSFPANPLKQFGHLKKDYIDKLIIEIKGLAKLLKETNKEIETLYIGGGTPTTLDAEEMDILIKALFKELDLSKIKEFTVEAGRPDTINREILECLKKNNVTRISINPQTMNQETLDKIGRGHSVEEIKEAFNLAREIGFDNINMDLILGLEGENVEMVRNTLEEIKKLSPESLTVHTLAIKRASKLKEKMDEYVLTQYEEMVKMIDLSMEY
ncbi:MAG: coproporphyrinogen dehydrogenase HemZ, partial [Peptostreptococcaceae bacterium]|nr:coproporphyrinogen dehydrogenase HemZ [Peptostreptococcaceae bacterium]